MKKAEMSINFATDTITKLTKKQDLLFRPLGHYSITLENGTNLGQKKCHQRNKLLIWL